MKADVTEPKSCFGQVFKFKLGSFSVIKEVHGAKAHPCPKLKTRPRFCPPSLGLSMESAKWKHFKRCFGQGFYFELSSLIDSQIVVQCMSTSRVKTIALS